MKPEDPDRIRFVTRHFNELQGLRCMVPLGLITLATGLTTASHSLPLLLLYGVLTAGAFLLLTRSRAYYRTTFGEVERQPVNPSAQLAPVSIFSPAGPAPRIGSERKFLNPSARTLFTVMGLAFIPFSILWAISPTVVIDQPTHWSHLASQTVMYAGARELTLEALVSMMYFVFGSLFLGIWLWRGRRLSQAHYLVLGLPLLGLAILGVALGLVLPALWDLGIAGITRYFVPALRSPESAQILCGTAFVLAGLLDHRQLVRALGQPAMEGQP
ncbi:MAG TPA: hypothetical protein VIA62_18625 [Thermoanaerobaculia bacterium]|jgi:hypothetical protein|nr:hypothetical protein [Thermoanaerobaculia bacterium]